MESKIQPRRYVQGWLELVFLKFKVNFENLNLNDFLSGDSKTKNEFIDQLGKGFSEIGFIAIKGHLLDDKTKDELYTEVKSFFNLSDEIKSKYIIKGLASQRGFTPFGKESAKGKNIGDLKEFWHFGQYISENEIGKYIYFPNIIVEELPEFNKVGEEVYKTLEKTAKYFIMALALYLDIDENYFYNYINNGN